MFQATINLNIRCVIYPTPYAILTLSLPVLLQKIVTFCTQTHTSWQTTEI